MTINKCFSTFLLIICVVKIILNTSCNTKKMKLSLFISLTIIATVCFTNVSCGNVLVVCILSSQSHKNVFQPITNGLAKKGHKITFLTAYKSKDLPENVEELVLLPGYDYFPKINTMDIRRYGIRAMLAAGFDHTYEACHQVFNNSEFKEVLNRKFDAVLFDILGNECFYGAVHKIDSPLILVSTLPAPNFFTSVFGNRLPSSFVQDPMLSFSDTMTFFQRVGNFLFGRFVETVFVLIRGTLEDIYRQHLGQDVSSIGEILNNASLLLMNSHFTLNYPRPTLPDVVEIGGGHCRPAKPLPKHIEDFANSSENGFIFFSLGSIVKPHELTDEVRNVFLNVFRRLKYNVLWKWPEETMPNLPDNVKLLKWVPQQDILAHPKIKLFMTHCGLLSLQEAVYHGVPVIGVPIFADQDLNADKAKQAGIGETIEILEVNEETLEETIRRVTENSEYKQKVQKLSELFRDRNKNPADDAVYWTEYIMRHKGAPHLRSAARDLNTLQYYSIDVATFLLASILFIIWFLKFVITLCVRRLCCKKGITSRKKND